MKIFASIFDLTKYMSFCPVCSSNREVEVSVGPDYFFNSPKINFCYSINKPSFKDYSDFYGATACFFNIYNKEIQLNITHGDGFGGYNKLSINIDAHNYFYIKSGNIPNDPPFFMYLQSQCRDCNLRMYSVSSDIEFKTNQKLSQLQIEEDYIYIDNVQVNYSKLKHRSF